MIEKVVAQIVAEVDDASLKKAGDDMKKVARDTKKELDKELLFKMVLDKAQTKLELDKARDLLKQAKKAGDDALVLKYTIKTQEIQSKMTEVSRTLNNFKNTGETGVSRLGALFDMLAGKLGGVNTIAGRTAQSVSQGLNGMGNTFAGLSSQLGALAIATGLYQIGSQALMLGDKLEQATISFETMLGSGEKAKVLLQDLAVFAQGTPFELIGIRDTAKQLLAVGIESENIIPTMKALGDVASMLGGPDVFGRLTYAFGQVKTAGKLTGNELRQFTEAGVPLLEELAKTLGKTNAEVKDMVSEGQISFADVQRVFKRLTEEGGKFANGQAVQIDTLTGKWGKFKDTLNLILEGIGTGLLPVAKIVVDFFTSMLEFGKKAVLGLQFLFAYSFSGIENTIIRLSIVFNGWGNSIKSVIAGVAGYFQDLGGNIGVFTNNVGVFFSNIPRYIGEAFNSGLKTIEDFLNKASNGINTFAKKLGFEKELVGKFSLGGINTGASKGQIQQYKTTFQDIAKIRQGELQKETLDYTTSALKRIDINNQAYENFTMNKLTELQTTKEINTEMIISDAEVADEKEKSSKSGADKEKNIQEKAMKEEIERNEKLNKWREKQKKDQEEKEKKRNEKLGKGLKDLENIYKEGGDVYKEVIDEAKKKSDEFSDKIKGLQDDVKDLNKDLQDLNSEKATTLGERNVEILKEQIDTQKELTELKQKSRNEFTIEDYQKEIELNKKLNDLSKEKLLIEGNLTQDQINEAKRVSELSPTEKFLEEFNLKKKAIEDEKLLKETEITNLQTQKDKEELIMKDFEAKKEALDEKYKNKVAEIEKQITDNTILEIGKRISALEAMKIKAIETANAMRGAGVVNNNSTVNNNPNVVVNANVSNNVDINTLGNKLADKIILSNKGID